MTERTGALYELFEKSRPYASDCESLMTLGALRAHPLNKVFVVINATTKAALRSTRLRIKSALQAMEECNPAVSELESALLLQEAELLSVLKTIKDIVASLIEAQGQLRRNRASEWDAPFFPAKKRESVSSSVNPSLQLLQHFETALEVLEGTVGLCRLRLTLCKEELALYKQEMFSFARLGVFSCLDPGNHPEEKEKCIEGSSTDYNRKMISDAFHRRGEGRRQSLAAVSVVDRAMKKAAKTVAGAPLLGRGRAWSLIQDCDAGGFRGSSDVLEANLPHFTYSTEEEKLLKEANIVLEKQQEEASAREAKAVEESVRELSQLTSLMNEQVLQQNEQFSILLKNTEMAQNNMQKGVKEVGETLSHFWNSTRQLIACLWLCTLLLLISNAVIR